MRDLLTGNVPSVVEEGSKIYTFPHFSTFVSASHLLIRKLLHVIS
jgi:hypothetical protein